MQFNLLVVIGIGLAAMFFGYFFGLFEGRGQGYKKRKQEDDGEEKRQVLTAVAPVKPSGSSLLKLSLDDNNQLRLDLDNQRVDTNQFAPEQRKRLIDLVVSMRPWMEGLSKLATPVQPPPSPIAPAAAPVSPPLPTPIAPSASPSKKAVAAPTTMVGQIDAILQLRLAGTALASRGIRLVESPEGGVVVEDGLNKYTGVGEVPDPQVQGMIRAAIADWEAKYTPGAR